MSGFWVLVRRQIRVNRTLLIVITVIAAINNIAQVTAYNSVFPNAATRAVTLGQFTSNTALRAFYGYPFDVGTPAGWLAWRSLGFSTIVMAIWALFITAGAIRGEEESGRAELALAQPQSRQRWFAAALTAVALETLILGAVNAVGLIVVCIPLGLMSLGQCLLSVLEMVVAALLFGTVGGVMSQLFTTTRGARIASVLVVVSGVLVRTIADAGTGTDWIRWLTPFGWFEELRPSTTPSIWAVVLSIAAAAFLLLITVPMLRVRDIGTGLLPHRDSRRPRRYLLGTSWQAALRDNLPQLSIWLMGTAIYMVVMGALAKTVLDLVRTTRAFRNVVGTGFAMNAYVAAVFSLMQLLLTLLVVTMLMGARGEESSGRLELLLARPLARVRWSAGHVLMASVVTLVVGLLSSVVLWLTISASGETVSLGAVMSAALNCIPLIVLTAGLGLLFLGYAPRATGAMYGLVTVAFLWEALGTAVKAPDWLLQISPFHALAAIPQQDFALLPATVMTAIGIAALIAGTVAFRRRDLALG